LKKPVKSHNSISKSSRSDDEDLSTDGSLSGTKETPHSKPTENDPFRGGFVVVHETQKTEKLIVAESTVTRDSEPADAPYKVDSKPTDYDAEEYEVIVENPKSKLVPKDVSAADSSPTSNTQPDIARKHGERIPQRSSGSAIANPAPPTVIEQEPSPRAAASNAHSTNFKERARRMEHASRQKAAQREGKEVGRAIAHKRQGLPASIVLKSALDQGDDIIYSTLGTANVRLPPNGKKGAAVDSKPAISTGANVAGTRDLYNARVMDEKHKPPQMVMPTTTSGAVSNLRGKFKLKPPGSQ
jgi:hypothetical protein